MGGYREAKHCKSFHTKRVIGANNKEREREKKKTKNKYGITILMGVGGLFNRCRCEGEEREKCLNLSI